jgi:hypothetical protein
VAVGVIGGDFAGGDEGAGIGERRRREQHRVDDGEDGGAGADRERQRHDGGGGAYDPVDNAQMPA